MREQQFRINEEVKFEHDNNEEWKLKINKLQT